MRYVGLVIALLVLGSYVWSWSKMGDIAEYWVEQGEKSKSK